MHNVDIAGIHKQQCGEGNAFFLEVEAGYRGDSSIPNRGQKECIVGLSTSVERKLAGTVRKQTPLLHSQISSGPSLTHTALSLRQGHRHADSHLSLTATSPPAAMMCGLIGGADEV